MSKEEYENIPVFYCNKCLSLSILHVGKHDYCKKCGSTDISYDEFDKWDKLYKEKYGRQFLTE